MVNITRSEIKRMENNVLDEETGMTEYDLFEHNHAYEDINVIEDVKEQYEN